MKKNFVFNPSLRIKSVMFEINDQILTVFEKQDKTKNVIKFKITTITTDKIHLFINYIIYYQNLFVCFLLYNFIIEILI